MKKPIFTSEAPAAIGPYSQGIRTGRFVFCSGQIPLDPRSGEIITGDMFFATALALGRLAGFAGTLLMFASFWIKLRDEETLMLRQFPDRYAAYRQRAKRIIPFML